MRMTFKDFLFRLLMAAALAASCCGLSQVAQAQGLGGAHQTRVAGKGGYDSRIFADRPTSYWPLREVTGTTAADRLGVNNGTYTGTLANGTYTGGYTLNQTGPLTGGGGVLLNGSTGWVNCGNVSSANPASSGFTAEVWMKLPSTSTSSSARSLASKGNAISTFIGWNILINAGANGPIVRCNASDNASTSRASSSGPTITDTSWHHVALVIDRGSNKIIGYLDGSNSGWSAGGAGPASDSISGFASITTTDELAFGVQRRAGASASSISAGLAFFDGTIGPCAIYPTALTAGQIAAHAAATDFSAYAALVRRDGATSFFPLNETTGTTAVDVLTTAGAYTLGQQGPLARMPSGGGGVLLNGSTGYVAAGNVAIGTSDFTFEVWCKLSNLTNAADDGEQCPMSAYATSNRGVLIGVVTDGSVRFAIRGPSASPNNDASTSAGLFVVNQWTHIAVTRSGTTQIIYVNGTLQKTNTYASTADAGTNALWLGHLNFVAAPRWWLGTIGPSAIYPTALTANQIYSHWAAGFRGYSQEIELHPGEFHFPNADDDFSDARWGNLCSMTLKLHQPITLRRAA